MWAGIFLSLSIGTKFYSILFFPFLIKPLQKIGIMTTILLTSLQYFFFYFLINFESSGFIVFLRQWRFNGGLFEFLYFISNNFNSYNLDPVKESILRVFLLITFSIFYVMLLAIFFKDKKKRNSFKEIFVYLGYTFFILYVFSPVIHPWYLLWAIIPIVLSSKKIFYPYWTFLIVINLSYLFYFNLTWVQSFILFFIEYFIVFLVTIIYLKKSMFFTKFKTNLIAFYQICFKRWLESETWLKYLFS